MDRAQLKIFLRNLRRGCSLYFVLVVALMLPLESQAKSSKPAKKLTKEQLIKNFDKDINKTLKIKNYRSRWKKLVRYDQVFNQLKGRQKVKLLQQQAKVLSKNGLPIVAAVYHAQAILVEKKAQSKIYNRSWKSLFQLSKQAPLENVILILAEALPNEKTVPYFKEEWNYYKGLVADRKGQKDQIFAYMDKVPSKSRFYPSAQMQMGLLHYAANKPASGEKKFKKVLKLLEKPSKVLTSEQRTQLRDLAHLSMARNAYQHEKFNLAIKQYRKVPKESPYYFDALFEHGWALFMGGYPNHALGAMHSAESSFFSNVYSPEVPVLRSMVYYWLCDYDRSRNALAHFVEKYQDSVNGLESYLGKKAISGDDAYRLFEDLVTGVSQDSLGIPKALLETAARKDTMRLVREQLASILEERNKVKNKGIFGTKKGSGKVLSFIDRMQNIARKNLGEVYRGELLGLKDDYESLNAQAKFLYVELLMSEKEQVLGTELHAKSKLSDKSTKRNVKRWVSKNKLSWSDSNKNEYWLDEIGYHIYNEESKCKTNEQIMEAEL